MTTIDTDRLISRFENLDTRTEMGAVAAEARGFFDKLDVLASITGSVGEPVFVEISPEESDNLVVDSLNSTNSVIVIREETPSFPPIESYDYVTNKSGEEIQKDLESIYSTMGDEMINDLFNTMIRDIAKDATAPASSTTFTYDFKFCQNRNASITGSVGGGY